MNISQFQLTKIRGKEQKAFELYKLGFSLRDVGKMMEKSHTWVQKAVKKLSTVTSVDSK